jgi:hypothetical protein
MATIYRVRLATADENLAREIGEHFYADYKNATAKQEELLRDMAKRARFNSRGLAYVHEETDSHFEKRAMSARRRLTAVATRLEDGSPSYAYHISTPWVEFSTIETEDR